MVSFGDGLGTNQRAIVLREPTGPNSETGPSSAPASGGGDPSQLLHYNPYPNTASPGQERECEAGNEVYAQGQVAIGNVPGNQGTVTKGQILAQTKAKKKKGRRWRSDAPGTQSPRTTTSGSTARATRRTGCATR